MSARVYRLLLFWFPRAFRRRFGGDMADLFADRLREARARGPIAVVALWRGTFADIAAHGLSERRAASRRTTGFRGTVMLQTFIQDVSFALRAFRRRSGFTAVVLVTLALGIGANTAIFSVVEAVLIRPLPYPNADRIVQVYETNRKYDFTQGVVSPFNFDVWERDAKSFEHLAAMRVTSVTLTGAGEPARIWALRVMPAFFDLAGVPPAHGRVISADDADSGRPVAVLSHALWTSRFEGDPAVIGRAITLDDQAATIVGVMPRTFTLPGNTDVYLPYALSQSSRAAVGSWYLSVLATLAPGVSIERAQAEMDTISNRLEAQYPKERGDRGVALVGLRADLSSRSADGLMLLQGIALFVLLIACANVANLGIAGASARRREIGIRAAIGANRGRIARQLFTESIVVSMAGAALGLLLASWSVGALVALAPSRMLPEGTTVELNTTVLVFTFAVAVTTGLATGVAPAWLGARADVFGVLKDTAASTTGSGRRGQRWLRGGLVTAEVALALVLVTGSLLFARSYARLMSQDPGFVADNVLTAHVTLPSSRYENADEQRAFWNLLLPGLGAVPGVTAVAASTALPFSNWEWQTWLEVEGRAPNAEDGSSVRAVTAGYFATLGIPMRLGREFTNEDRAGADPAAIVNEAFARRFLSNSPIGQRIRTERNGAARWMTVVGVSASTRHTRLDQDPQPELYRPLDQAPISSLILALRTEAAAAALAPLVSRVVHDLDPRLPVQTVRTMEEAIGATTSRRKFDASLVGILAGLAVALAVAGIVGVMMFVVGLRTREAGIRVALGGSPAGVQALFVRQGLSPVMAGVVLGLAGAIALSGWLRAQLFGIEPTDPATLALAAGFFLSLAIVAAWIPARRAGRADPTAVLRTE